MCVYVCVRSIFRLYSITLCLALFSIFPLRRFSLFSYSFFFSFSKLSSSSSSLSFCVNGSAKRQNSQEQNQPIMFESLFKMNGNLCVVVFVRRILIPIAASGMAKWWNKKVKYGVWSVGVMHIQMETIRAVLYWSNFNSIETQYSLFYLRREQNECKKEQKKMRYEYAVKLNRKGKWKLLESTRMPSR